jgi:hypothetical protein
MTAGQWVILLVVVLVALALWIVLGRRRRSGQLRERFGPEYDRLVADRDGDRKRVEAELDERSKRRAQFDIKELPAADRDRYAEAWRRAQLRFIDEPEVAIVEADRLVVVVMRARGYPVEDFEQRAADLSVDHPAVVQNYRAGHEIADRHNAGQASTEDLRQAMVHYRALFEALLDIDTPVHEPGDSAVAEHPSDVAAADRTDREAAERAATDRTRDRKADEAADGDVEQRDARGRHTEVR